MRLRGRAASYALLGATVLAVPLVAQSDYRLTLLNLILVYVIAALGLNVIVGWVRELSFGHAGLMGLGAYTAAWFATRAHLGLWVGAVFAVLVCMAAGFVVGLPTLRLRATYFGLATFGFNVIIVQLINNAGSLTGGPQGFKGIPGFSVDGRILSGTSFYYFALLVAAAAVALASRMQRSSFGRALLAISEGPQIAAAMGIPVARAKTTAFVISAAYAGAAGALYAGLIRYLSPDSFDVGLSVAFIVMVIIGGLGSIWGVVAGAVLVTLLPEVLRWIRDYYLLVYGVGLLLVLIFLPDGLASLPGRIRRWHGVTGDAVMRQHQ